MTNKTVNKWIVALIIAILLGAVVGFCASPHKDKPGPNPSETVKMDTVTRTIPLVQKLEPEQKIKETSNLDTVYLTLPVDTQAILREYFTRHIYQREFSDSNFCASLEDTVFANTLFAGQLKAMITRNVVERTITVEKTAWMSPKWYLGGYAGSASFGFFALRNHGANLFGVGAQIYRPGFVLIYGRAIK